VPGPCAAWPAPDAGEVGVLIAVLVLVLSTAVVLVVSGPLRASRQRAAGAAGTDQLVRDELTAAREAKYREIRDAELDYRTGKLSREDYDTIDSALRAEAITILDRIEKLERDDRLGPGALEQHDGEHEEQDREEEGPAV
jgi:hypothetical protein